MIIMIKLINDKVNYQAMHFRPNFMDQRFLPAPPSLTKYQNSSYVLYANNAVDIYIYIHVSFY